MSHPSICRANYGVFAIRLVSARVSGPRNIAKERSVSASKIPVPGRAAETGSLTGWGSQFERYFDRHPVSTSLAVVQMLCFSRDLSGVFLRDLSLALLEESNRGRAC
ncbi:hypothetical protein NWI01_32810 [Nitrobacter winogradskyi]|uniref:Uncharacterized protein n=1 Tax=Nitrobacter winogradskyi TaxID=913 RepID=A0A4Y3WHL1_NITWI|nr:hypothetical protein NWI01_32810 [Nitrobacter winogradskyi]